LTNKTGLLSHRKAGLAIELSRYSRVTWIIRWVGVTLVLLCLRLIYDFQPDDKEKSVPIVLSIDIHQVTKGYYSADQRPQRLQVPEFLGAKKCLAHLQ
jgi:hypothetical protein